MYHMMHIEEPPQPCPFCDNDDIQYDEGLLSPSGHEMWLWLFCSYCGAEGGSALSEEEALENWNMRANVHVDMRAYDENCPFCDGMNIKLQHQETQFWYECADCGAKAGVGGNEQEARENWNIRRYGFLIHNEGTSE